MAFLLACAVRGVAGEVCDTGPDSIAWLGMAPASGHLSDTCGAHPEGEWAPETSTRRCQSSIVVSIPSCLAGDPCSIPDNNASLFSDPRECRHPFPMTSRVRNCDIRLSSLATTLGIPVPMVFFLTCAVRGVTRQVCDRGTNSVAWLGTEPVSG